MIKKLIQKGKEILMKGITFSGIGFITGFLGSLAGSKGTSKGIRAVGIPLVLTILAWFIYKELWVISTMLLWIVFQAGHGVPHFVEGYEDEGSTLGKFWYDKMNGDKNKTDICLRATKAFVACLILGTYPFQTGYILSYLVGSIIIFTGYTVISWRALGRITKTFKGKKYYFLKSDYINYALFGIGASLIINGGF